MKSIGEIFNIPTQECFKCGNWVRELNRKFLLCNVCESRSDRRELIQLSLLRGMPYEEPEMSIEFLDSLEAREIDEGMLAEYIKAFAWRQVFPDTNYSMSPVMWVLYLSVLAQEQRDRCEELLDEVIDLREKSPFREDIAKFETEKYLSEIHSIAWTAMREDIKYLRRLGIANGQDFYIEVENLVRGVWGNDVRAAREGFDVLSQRMTMARRLRKVDEQIRRVTGHRLMEVALGLRKVSDLGLPVAIDLADVEPMKFVERAQYEMELSNDLLAKVTEAADFYWMFKDSGKRPAPKYLEAAEDLENAYDPAARRQNHPALETINDLLVSSQTGWPRFLDNFRWSYELMLDTENSFTEALAAVFANSHRDKLIPIFCSLPESIRDVAMRRKSEHQENQEFENRMQFGESRWNVGQQDMGAIIDNRPRGYVARSWKNRWSK